VSARASAIGQQSDAPWSWRERLQGFTEVTRKVAAEVLLNSASWIRSQLEADATAITRSRGRAPPNPQRDLAVAKRDAVAAAVLEIVWPADKPVADSQRCVGGMRSTSCFFCLPALQVSVAACEGTRAVPVFHVISILGTGQLA
jgi:hypothetical protein